MIDGNFKKPFQIRAWPDLTGLNPLLTAVDRLPKRGKANFHLDFSRVHSIDAVGLAIHFACLAKIRSSVSEAIFSISPPKLKEASKSFYKFPVENLLNKLNFEAIREQDLFSNLDFSVSNFNCGDKETVEAVICVAPDLSKTRDLLVKVVQKEIKNFFGSVNGRWFSYEQVMIILLEMVKNTLDHSSCPAFLGIRMERSNFSDIFSFSYCDTGSGIVSNVRQHINGLGNSYRDLDEIEEPEGGKMLRLSMKGGFSDLWHWALQPGNSTRSGNGVNFGLGLALITEGARNCGMRLLMKDADSICTLTEIKSPYSHREIRQNIVKTNAQKMLMYHGRLERLK